MKGQWTRRSAGCLLRRVADVYAENRSVPIAGGVLADSFGRWSVHVYRLTASAARSS